jgi:cell division protein FtsN
MKKQSGGTLLGFVMGVVVGLALALAVAVYVTKVPVQFLNKGQSRTSDQDAAETRKNRDWDPNAPLYGKNPAKPAVPEQAVSEATAPNAVAASAAPAKKELKPAVTADPLGDLVNGHAAGVSADPFIYFVQAGAFRTPDDAESQRAKLSLIGIEAKVSEREQSGRTVFRVRSGPFGTKEEAEKSKERLDAAGLDTALVRVQR